MKIFKSVLVVMFLSLVIVSTVFAATLVLDWDASTLNTDGTTLTDLAGYKIYQSSTSGGSYSLLASVASTTTHYSTPITVPDNGVIVKYYVATAYDTHGNESVYSNEVTKSFFGPDTISPRTPSNLR